MKGRGARRGRGGIIEAPPERTDLEESTAPPAKRCRYPSSSVRTPASWAVVLWSGLKLVAGLALVVTVSLAVAWGVHQYASTTPRFSVVIIDVVGNRRLSDSEVLRRAGVAEGMNLFVLDTEATEQALLAVPWIEEVKVTRELPRTLRIELVEREAAAVAVVGSRSWLVTPEGVPFKELAAGDPYDLPLLTGVTLEDLLQDREGAVGRLKTGIDVLRQYGRTAPGRVHVAQEVNLGEDGGVVLTVGKQGMTFHLGRGQVRRKLLMAERIIAQLGRRGRMPGILFLDNEAHPERVVARMR